MPNSQYDLFYFNVQYDLYYTVFLPIVNITDKLLLNIPFFNTMCTTMFYIKSSKHSVQQDLCLLLSLLSYTAGLVRSRNISAF